jgi:hypothetical protein
MHHLILIYMRLQVHWNDNATEVARLSTVGCGQVVSAGVAGIRLRAGPEIGLQHLMLQRRPLKLI